MRPTLTATIFAMVVACSSIYADSVTFPITVQNKKILVDVLFKDKNGSPIHLVGQIDDGNNDNVGLRSDVASTLGLTVGAAHPVSGIGGNTGANETSIPSSNPGIISGATAGTFGVSAEGAGFIVTKFGNPAVQVMLGHDFLNPDPAGMGAYRINEARGTMTVYNHEQALELSSLPFQTPVVAVAEGTINPDPNGTAYAVNTGVTFGVNTVFAPFVISTGVDTTLISASLASVLGIPSSGPLLSVIAAVDTFSVSSTDVCLNVFPGLGFQAVRVGIIPDSLNPMGINVLGSDFLGQFAQFQVNEATSTFSAAVPEPSSLVLEATGLLVSVLGYALTRQGSSHGRT